eukprot:TRINITY_DN2020_c0_g1_i14.p2 TRINITY_DN2020_c0_g1~~TRINITY_DN2020_c0_g1_i14.p2  ORF type:complete len:182 (+),score=43.45 TRINITY_DN2020_c0_g1_i14:193-738(+)
MSLTPFTLYTGGFSPNGNKITIACEELGLPYENKMIDLMKGEQREEWYLAINPNGRIPSLIDHNRGDFKVFESGAILLYLCDHYDKEGKLCPKDLDGRSEVTQWLMFQMAGVGPMQGQANHFYRYAQEKIEYGVKRYQDEVKRLKQWYQRRVRGKFWGAGKEQQTSTITVLTERLEGYCAL